MWTDIHLINSPNQDVNYNHTPYFSSLTNQINWFLSKTVISIENANYHRKENNVKVGYHVDELQLVNYLMVNNGKKWFFYFVMDKVYINEKTTELILRLDVIQSYLFDFSLGNCLIERIHTNRYYSNGNVILEPMFNEEDFSTGEYSPFSVKNIYNYGNKGGYIITSSDLLGSLTQGDYTSTSSGGDSGGGNTGGGEVTIGDYPYNSSISSSRNARFKRVWKGVKEAQKHGLFPSVTYAQYVMESGWDGSTLSETYNNAFGIKADSSWTGRIVTLPTQEYINGEYVTVNANWRAYDDINDSVRDRTQFLLENPRYTEGGVFRAKNYADQCRALQNSGYATDPNYASLLISIIEYNNFTMYDKASGGSSSGSGSTSSNYQYLNLHGHMSSWAVYNVNGPYTLAYSIGALAPSNWGGLSYKIYSSKGGNVYEINTESYGRCCIFAPRDNDSSITYSPLYEYGDVDDSSSSGGNSGGSSGSDTTDIRQKIVNSAMKLIGKPYRFGGNISPLGSSDGTDCSGLCQWAYNDAGATSLTSMSGRWTTYTMYPNSVAVSIKDARPGDVVFSVFSSPGVPEHVYMIKYVQSDGNSLRIIEAQQPGTNILERSVYYDSNKMVIRRLLK